MRTALRWIGKFLGWLCEDGTGRYYTGNPTDPYDKDGA